MGDGMQTTKYSPSAKDVGGAGGNAPYSTGRAVAGGFALAAVLWWIPFIGPAMAGYYAGRRSGSFIKGAISSSIAGGGLMLAVMAASYYLLGPAGFPNTAVDVAAGTLMGVYSRAGIYLNYFFNPGTAEMALTPLGIMVAFGCIGGSLSGLYRQEAASLIASGAVYSAIRPLARSVELYEKGKELGFESYNDCTSVRESAVSVGKDTRQRSDTSTSMKKKAVTTTVQAVTTTVGEGVTPTASSHEKTQGPFSDILRRSEIHGNGKDSVQK
ncbi:MAG: hypothetical protein PWR17_654 [Candidatus Methanomethylophilaceae archaeon]|nr:hypothetical protein [Candidatus Methanomethylophilaceae archaeon]